METITIGEIVSIAPSYTSEVNIQLDFEDEAMNALKVRGYIPTAVARQACRQIMQGLLPMSDRRVHLVTGMYGTGKSHFGLVLANLFGRLSDDALVANFMRNVANADSETANLISRNRNGLPQKFLVVILDQTTNRGGFNYVLLSGLQAALKKEKINYTPKTQYGDAEALLEKMVQDPMLKARWENELAKHQSDVRRLQGNLHELKIDAFDLFCLAHKAVMLTPFLPEHYSDPAKVYGETVKHIRASANFAGILVVADEFGAYLTDMARDPDGREALSIQNFVEFCKRSRENQVHFLVIAHRTLADYSAGLITQDDWKKVSGRFLENEYSLNVASGNNFEMVEMIDTVLQTPREAALRNRLWPQVQIGLAAVPDWVLDTKLFAGQPRAWVENSLVAGCYPLHPGSTFCLPWLAQRVGQANRTAFKFLESREPGGLQQFIESTNVFAGDEKALNLYTPDRLIVYFGRGATEQAEYRAIMTARDGAIAVCGNQPIPARLIDLLAVLEIVGQPTLPPTRSMLVSLLATTQKEKTDIEHVIDTLVEQHVIRLRTASGRYELVRQGAGEVQAHEAILKVKEILRDSFNLIDALTQRTDLTPVPATLYEDKHGLPRAAMRRVVSPRHLDNLEAYRSEINNWYLPGPGATQNIDALILYVLARGDGDINAARDRLTSGTGHDQLIVAVPQRPFLAAEAALELAAIQRLRSEPKIIEGAVDADDLVQAEQDRQLQLEQAIKSYFAADNFVWYYGRNVSTTVLTKGEEAFVSAILLAIFHKTPAIHDEALNSVRDNKKKDRILAMQRLLEVDAPIQILKRLGPPSDRMLRAALRDTELLEKKADIGQAEEFELRKTAPDQSPLAEIWTYLRKEVTKLDTAVPVAEVVCTLLAPPYGLTRQLLEMLLAAVFRTVKDQCVVFSGYSRVKESKRSDNYQTVPLVAESIPALVRAPGDYVLLYYEIAPAQRNFVQTVITTLDPQGKSATAGGLLEKAREAIVAWFAHLPPATRDASDMSQPALATTQLLRNTENFQNAKALITENLPAALLGAPVATPWGSETTRNLEVALRQVYEELENHIQGRQLVAIEKLCDVFGTSGRTQQDLDEAMRGWYAKLADYQRLHHFSGDAGQLITAINGSGNIVERYLISLPTAMSLPPYSEWLDMTNNEVFALRVMVAKQQIENWTPATMPTEPPSSEIPHSEIVKSQIRTLLANSGFAQDAQMQILNDLLKEFTG